MMDNVHRRELLKTTGVGVGLAMGGANVAAHSRASTAIASESEVTPSDREPVGAFDAVAEEAFIVIDEDNPDDERLELSGDEIDEDITIEGLIFDDDTWESRDIDFPDLDPQELLAEFGGDDLPIDPGDISGSVDISVDPMEGVFDRDAGKMTGDISLTVDVDLTILGLVDLDIDIQADAPLTTEESNASDTAPIEGGTENFDEEEASATLVSNEFEIPETGADIGVPGVDIDIDEELGLPSPEGRNYLSLTLSLEISDIDDFDGPLELTEFTTTHTDGYISFDADAPEDNRFEFGEDVDEDIVIDGVIYDDGTWEAESVSIPPIDLRDEIINATLDAAPFDLGFQQVAEALEYTVAVDVNNFDGIYDPQDEVFTGFLDLEIDIDASIDILGWNPTLVDAVVDPGTVQLTTGTSDGPLTPPMEGSATGMATETPELNIVGQEFAVDASGSGTISDTITQSVLGTPVDAGRNWVDIDLELELDDPDSLWGELLFRPIADQYSPPLDSNDDGFFEDTTGDGSTDSVDVQALYDHLWDEPVQTQSTIFAFAGEPQRSEVRIADVQALHSRIMGGQTSAPPDIVVPQHDVDVLIKAKESGGDSVQVDEKTELEIVVAVRPGEIDGPVSGLESIDMEIELSDPEIAAITDFDIAVEGDILNGRCEITDSGSKLTLEAALLDDTLEGSDINIDGELPIATVEIEGKEPGDVAVDPVIESFPKGLFGQNSTLYETAREEGAGVTVQMPGPPPIRDIYDAPTQVFDVDDLYEDVTGTGNLDIADIQALFENLERDTVQEYAWAYNFSGQNPETVTIFDIQALYNRYQTQ